MKRRRINQETYNTSWWTIPYTMDAPTRMKAVLYQVFLFLEWTYGFEGQHGSLTMEHAGVIGRPSGRAFNYRGRWTEAEMDVLDAYSLDYPNNQFGARILTDDERNVLSYIRGVTFWERRAGSFTVHVDVREQAAHDYWQSELEHFRLEEKRYIIDEQKRLGIWQPDDAREETAL